MSQGQSQEWTKWEENGRFGLSFIPEHYDNLFSDDIGSGLSQVIMCFASADAREYYIQAESARRAHNSCARKLEHLRAELRKVLGARSVRKRIRELLGDRDG